MSYLKILIPALSILAACSAPAQLSDADLQQNLEHRFLAMSCIQKGYSSDPKALSGYLEGRNTALGSQDPQRVSLTHSWMLTNNRYPSPTRETCRAMDSVAFQWQAKKERIRQSEQSTRRPSNNDLGVIQCTDVGALLHCNSF